MKFRKNTNCDLLSMCVSIISYLKMKNRFIKQEESETTTVSSKTVHIIRI